MTRIVESWGIGRKDYSQGIESSVVPTIISHQSKAYYTKDFTISANDSTTISETFDSAHFIFNIYISVDANVLISVVISSEGVELFRDSGYQKIVKTISSSFPVDSIDITITNHSDIDVNGNYTHFGVKGIENIAPFTA